MYDVLVIGAGPAGSTAARVLAGRGYRVLLVEKCKMPRYKSCSGVLIQKSVDLIGKYFGGSTPGEDCANRLITGAWFLRMTVGKNTALSSRALMCGAAPLTIGLP